MVLGQNSTQVAGGKKLETREDVRRRVVSRQFESAIDAGALAINDILFNVNLDADAQDVRTATVTEIEVAKQALNNNMDVLRMQNVIRTKSGRSNLAARIRILFVGEEEVNHTLRRLIAEIRNVPYVVVHNDLLAKVILPGLQVVDNTMAFTVSNARLSTLEGLPSTWALDLQCVWFNYLPYTNDLRFREKWEPLQEILDTGSPVQLGNFGLRPTVPVKFLGFSEPYIKYVDQILTSEKSNGTLRKDGFISNRTEFTWREYIYVQPPSKRRADLQDVPRPGTLSQPSFADVKLIGSIDFRINSKAQEDFEELATLFKKRFGKPLPLTSMFRSKDKQKLLYENDKEIANRPGTSTHESGQGIDILLSDYQDIKRKVNNLTQSRDHGISNTEWLWLVGKAPNQTQVEKDVVRRWKVSKEEFGANESWHFTHQRSGTQQQAYEFVYKSSDEQVVAALTDANRIDNRDVAVTLSGGDLLLDAKEKLRGTANERNDKEMEEELKAFIDLYEVDGYKYYRGTDAFVTNDISGVFFRERSLIIAGDPNEKSQVDLVPNQITCFFENFVSSIPIQGQSYPTHQFLGSSDTNTSILLSALSDGALADIANMVNMLERQAIEFRRIPHSSVVRVNNDVLRIMGIKDVLISSYEVRTQPDSPTLRMATLGLEQYSFTREEIKSQNVRSNRDIQQVAVRVLLNQLEPDIIDGPVAISGERSFKVKDDLRNDPRKAFLSDKVLQLLRVLQSRQRSLIDGFAQQRQGWLELLGAQEFLVPVIKEDPFKTLEAAFLAGAAEQDTILGRTRVTSFLSNLGTFVSAGFRNLLFDPTVLVDQGRLTGLPVAAANAAGAAGGTLIGNLRENQTINGDSLRESAKAFIEEFGEEFTDAVTASQDVLLERTKQDILGVVNDLIFELSNTDGVDLDFTRQFPELTPLINEMVKLEDLNSREAYPDLALPAHPFTGRIIDTEPDFFVFNDSEEGGLGDIPPGVSSVARNSISRSVESFQDFMAPNGLFATDPKYKVGGKSAQPAAYEAGPDSPPISNVVTIPPAKRGDHRGIFKYSHDGLYKQNVNAYPEGTAVKMGRDLQDASDPVLNPPNAQHVFDQSNLMDIIKDFTSRSDETLTMRRAFPAFKLFFIENDSDLIVKAFDDWYSYNAIREIQLVKTRKNPVDYLVVEFSNISGLLDNRVFNDSRKSNEPSEEEIDRGDTKEFFDPEKVNTEQENPFERLVLKPGLKVELRLGYTNDPKKMPLEFIGQITEIEPMDNGDCIRVLCQSYATELIYKIKGDDPRAEYGWFHSDTAELLGGLICEPEVVHFGRWRFRDRIRRRNERAATEGRNSIFDRWFFLDQPQDDNIFAPRRDSYFRIFPQLFGSDDISSVVQDGILDYNVYQTTIWEVFKEMELRHPGFIASPVPFESGGNQPNRMTMFFGVPSQRYWARGATRNEQQLRSQVRDIEKKASQLRSGILEPRTILENIFNRIPFVGDSRDTRRQLAATQKGAIDKLERDGQKALEKIDALIHKRYRSFRNYHMVTSSHHIVANNIKASAKGVFNSVIVQYVRDTSHQTGFFIGAQTVSENGTVNYYADDIVKMRADDDIPDESIIEAKFSYPNCEGPRMARRYALGLMLRHLRDVYKGSLVITGRPGIKPYDICYVFDTYSGMYGPVEVEEVTHVISRDTGWVTEIVPDMCVYANEFSSWPLLEAGAVVTGHLFEAVSDGGSAALKTLGFEQGFKDPGVKSFTQGVGVTAGGLAVGGTIAAAASAPLLTLGGLGAGAFFMAWGATKFIRYTQHRQPLKIWPLMYHKKPYIAALNGYKTNKIFTSYYGKLSTWWNNTRQDLRQGLNILDANLKGILDQ